MDATVFFFALYDEASETVQVVRQVDRGVPAERPPIHLLYGTEAEELVAPQSCVVVPILSGGRVLGVLSAQSYRPDA